MLILIIGIIIGYIIFKNKQLTMSSCDDYERLTKNPIIEDNLSIDEVRKKIAANEWIYDASPCKIDINSAEEYRVKLNKDGTYFIDIIIGDTRGSSRGTWDLSMTDNKVRLILNEEKGQIPYSRGCWGLSCDSIVEMDMKRKALFSFESNGSVKAFLSH